MRRLAAGTDYQPPTPAPLPPSLAGASWVAFGIGPDGALITADPPPTPPSDPPPTAAGWLAGSCLTLVPARYAEAADPPPDFVTLQVNPYTGACTVYRP